MNLALLSKNEFRKIDGISAAPCNDPATGLKASEIEAVRAEPIRRETFTAFMFLICERFDREPSQPLLEYYYKRARAAMSESEFQAAAHDAMGAKMFFADLLPYLLEHAEKQRENGPDLWALQVAEQFDDPR